MQKTTTLTHDEQFYIKNKIRYELTKFIDYCLEQSEEKSARQVFQEYKNQLEINL